ncbi:MAG TPA: metal-dependent hydrolase [Vicinamibacteria bacterium]|nr:metal-dependent hydrolase [Vicinamibacteria bacterium]
MDNITHTLTGVLLGRMGLEGRSPGAMLSLVIASNLPDADLLFSLQGPETYLAHHRDVSHSVVGAPLLAMGLAGAVSRFKKDARALPLFFVSLAAIACHVSMDLWTSYGTRVLAPFDRTFYTWDLVFIVDPWLLLLLLVALLAAHRLDRPAPVARIALGLVLAYVGVRAVLHDRALEAGLLSVPSGPASVARAAALPTPLSPLRWRYLADVGDAYYLGDVSVGAGAPHLWRRDKQPETAAVARVRESSAVAGIFLGFSTFPWLRVTETAEGTEVSWTDLRFERPERESFVARALVDKDGRVKRESFRF